MSKEQSQPTQPFTFTEHEKLWSRISHDRLQALLGDPHTTIHSAAVDTNSYGEFLFLTISRPAVGQRQVLTFYGCGLHEYRERWYTQEWAWFEASPFPRTLEQRLTQEEAQELIAQRLDEIAPYVTAQSQSERGQLFDLLADMTDDDGAIADLDELEHWLDSLDDL